MTPPTNLIRQEIRDHIKEEFSTHEYGRAGEAPITSADDVNLRLVYAFPMSGPPVKQRWGMETFKLTGIIREIAKGKIIALDNDRAKSVCKFAGAELDGNFLKVTLQFNDATAFIDAKSQGVGRLEINYRCNRWEFASPRDITVTTLTLVGIGLFSPSFALPKGRNKPADIGDGPFVQLRKIRYPSAAGNPGNATVDAEKREAVVEFVDNQLFTSDNLAESVILSPEMRLQPLVGKPVFPFLQGAPVAGAAPVGKIVDAWWEADNIEDAEGNPKVMAYGLARIVFDATPAGDRELAAFVAKERRAVATTVKAIRHIRELVGQDYANRCIFWEPIAIGIEGATVVTQAEQSAATPAPASKPGLLQRITDAFTPGRAAA